MPLLPGTSITGMATWRDGPEYAPTARPEAFVEPPAAPLESPPVDAHPSAGAPGEHPGFTAPEQPTPDLATLIPSVDPGRDPRLAFTVVSSTLTGPTAWGAAHTAPAGALAQQAPSWSPQQPLSPASTPVMGSIPAPPPSQPRAMVNPQPFPAPGTPQWFAPPDAGQRYQPPAQVSLGQVVKAVTPAVLITLVIGALINSLSIVMLALAFGLASRIPYRRSHVQVSFVVGLSLVGLAAVVTLVLEDFYLSAAWAAASGVAQLVCWLLPFALGLIVALAVGKGEPPGPRP